MCADYEYNFDRDEFIHKPTGDAAGPSAFDALSNSVGARRSLAGRNTLARGIFAASVVRASGPQGRDSFLAWLDRLERAEYVPFGLEGVLYSKANAGAPGGAALTARVDRVAAELRKRGVPVRDLEVLDALLDLIGDDRKSEAEFIAWLTGDVDVRAGELAEAMIARAGRR